ncbi:MAG: VRR-NUC domain-containing protein [Bacteroides sp.]|nr:VRR-NUC domain-containing protein [Bacteroides sp.]
MNNVTTNRNINNLRKAASSEHALQVACVNWFRMQYSRYADLLLAIPNGGQRDIRVARKLKDEGTLAGVPDLFLALPRGEHHGLWIEMKNGKVGRVSESQTKMMHTFTQQGYVCAVCRSFDEFVQIIQQYICC